MATPTRDVITVPERQRETDASVIPTSRALVHSMPKVWVLSSFFECFLLLTESGPVNKSANFYQVFAIELECNLK